MGRNTTGPPLSAVPWWVTLHMRRRVTDDDDRRQGAKQYWPPRLCVGKSVIKWYPTPAVEMCFHLECLHSVNDQYILLSIILFCKKYCCCRMESHQRNVLLHMMIQYQKNVMCCEILSLSANVQWYRVWLFSARRYASTVYAVASWSFICLSVRTCCPSQAGIVLKRLNRIMQTMPHNSQGY